MNASAQWGGRGTMKDLKKKYSSVYTFLYATISLPWTLLTSITVKLALDLII
jgi:hypothetical protein